jgi:hypothetical protein
MSLLAGTMTKLPGPGEPAASFMIRGSVRQMTPGQSHRSRPPLAVTSLFDQLIGSCEQRRRQPRRVNGSFLEQIPIDFTHSLRA